jgi:hypothetical protein
MRVECYPVIGLGEHLMEGRQVETHAAECCFGGVDLHAKVGMLLRVSVFAGSESLQKKAEEERKKLLEKPAEKK